MRRPLGTLANKSNGIVVEEFISANVVEEDAHDVRDFRASGTGQGKLPRPQIHLSRFYPGERALRTLRRKQLNW
jgi:hypothetical protein